MGDASDGDPLGGGEVSDFATSRASRACIVCIVLIADMLCSRGKSPMGKKLRKIKARWSSIEYNQESEEFTAAWRSKAKGLDPVTGFLRVGYSAGPDVFEWYADSNDNGAFDMDSDRGLIRGDATSVDTDAFFDLAKQGSGKFQIKELRNDNLIAAISSGGQTAVVSDFGGWTFSELFMVLGNLG